MPGLNLWLQSFMKLTDSLNLGSSGCLSFVAKALEPLVSYKLLVLFIILIKDKKYKKTTTTLTVEPTATELTPREANRPVHF
jgi:hypothetical protein